MNSVAVVNYGMGNLRSVSKALEHVAPQAKIWVTQDPAQIREADRVVFPGVGAMRDCMTELHNQGLLDVVRECAASRPFLGICLGMQALLEFSEENEGTPGLGLLPGQVRRFPADLREQAHNDGDPPLKIPHMGWNQAIPNRSHPLWAGIPQDSRFYFVHSFYVAPRDGELWAATTHYGFPFASAVARDNLFAVQFHPEKSQRAGLALLANFMTWDGRP